MKRLLLFALLISAVAYAQNAEKKIAVLEIVDRDENVSQGVKLMLRGRLTASITATPGYVGVDRVDMDAVFLEHDFQRSGLVDEHSLKHLGVALGADFVMVAEAAWFNSCRTELVITVKLLDVESFQIVRTAMANTAVSSSAIDESCRSLARKMLKPSGYFQQAPGSGQIPNY